MSSMKNSNDIRTGFFTYPWDLVKEGSAHVIEMMATRYLSNAVVVNANYHHARVLRPRNQGPKTLQYHDAVAAFHPQPEFYGDGKLLPVVDAELADSGVLAATREACKAHDMDYGIWVVGLHNSSLGEQNPELCVQNCFGDVYTYALCPSRRESQQYMVGLVNDICAQFAPDRIVVEAVGVLGLRHWVHHELFLTDWDESLEMLFSLCFCPACTHKAQEKGIDVKQLRQNIRQWADFLLEEERGSLPLAFTHGEVASLLMEIEDLWAYLQLGSETVTELVESLHQATRKNAVKLEIIPSSFHRPVSRAWMERAALKPLSGVCDGILVSSYFSDPAEVAADLHWASFLMNDAPIIAGLNACAPTQNAASLEAQAVAGASSGCEALYFYNYGLLSEKRLKWVSQANAAVRSL